MNNICSSSNLNQMHQYHGLLPQELPAESQPRHLEDFHAIAARLHIKDMGSRKNTRELVHTVEDEYRSYTKGTLTKQGDNPLKFWDVRFVCHRIVQLTLTNTHRQTVKHTRSSSP